MNKQAIKFISPDIEHRYIRKLSEEHLDIEFTKDYEKIKQSHKPMIIWNNYGYLAHPKKTYKKKYELYKYFRKQNKDVYIVERGALPNTIFIDKNNILVYSDSYNEDKWNKDYSSNQLKKAEKYIDWLRYNEHTLEPQKSNRISDKTEFFESLYVNRKFDKVVFVPLQIHNDTVTILWSDWVKNTKNFLKNIKYLAKQNPNVLFLVKNHPCEDESYNIYSETQNLKIVDNYHYKDCLEYCDKVITINSGVGLQAMCWNKPVGICGEAFYQFDEINTKINNYHELQEFINSNQSVDFSKVKRFIYYLTNEFYTICTMQKVSRNSSVPKLIESVRLPNNCYTKEIKNDKLKILYCFNEYGWAFEFEANNYAKYSEHNIIPFHYNPTNLNRHKSDFNRIIHSKSDIIVLPSAWHYFKYKNDFWKKIKDKGIKLVIQINSHFEPKYFCKHADLVITSSQKLYDIINEKYEYNLIKQHHFVDTKRFNYLGLNKQNIIGWAGRFDNPIKRTNLLFKLGHPILIKSNYHGFLNDNRNHDEMVDFYKKINILLITSKEEGTPYPLLEAMSMGKIVLATDVGICAEILPEFCIIKENDEQKIIEQFKEKINYLLDNPIYLNQLSYDNFYYIQNNLAWKSQYTKLDKIYKHVSFSTSNKMIYGDESFRALIQFLNSSDIEYWLLNDSCLDAIRFCDLKLQPNTLHIGSVSKDIKKLKKVLLKNGWKKLFNSYIKEDKKIKLTSENKRKTKIMTIFGIDVNVPYPVIAYLKDLYGDDWRNYGIKK